MLNADATHTIRIDGREVEIPAGATLLAAALEAGIYIPHLCHHGDLPPARTTEPAEAVYRAGQRIANEDIDRRYDGCGLCLVEVEGTGEPQHACDLATAEGMVVTTAGARLTALRQLNLARVLAHHPHACLTCAQKEGCSREPCSSNVNVPERCCPLLGRCELEKVAGYIGIGPDTPRYVPRGLPPETHDDLFVFAPELCVSCLRCVRACHDLRGVDVLGFVHHQGEVVVGRRAPTEEEDPCRFCGACVEVCPTGALTDQRAGTGDRDARLVPCRTSCPAGMDVPRFLRAVAGGDLDGAAQVSLDRLPLPHALGRVCFHPCEGGCRRAGLGGSLSVCRLRRHVFDMVETAAPPWTEAPSTGPRVAVIGSGPAGLAAAHFLRRLGREVTVFEAAPEPGGMLRYGIPTYRLPREVLQQDLDRLEAQGVRFQCGTAFNGALTLESLKSDGYAAVLLAAGAQAPKPLAVPGVELNGVLPGVEFLRQVAAGAFPDADLQGKTVLVIGGGNVAMDAARTALRLGAASVCLVCLEAAGEMPADEPETEAARAEGIEIRNSWGPREILGNAGTVTGVRLVRCTAVLDAAGRFAPRFDEATQEELEADRVILAIGQAVEPSLREHPDLQFRPDGFLRVRDDTLALTREGVFAAGDIVLGPSSVVRSVASGRKAAEAIDRYLGGSGEVPSILESETPNPWLGRQEGFGARQRQRPAEVPATDRIRSFGEVEPALTTAQARAEAARCLQCDLRLSISAPVFPPLPWLEFTEDAVAAVPETEGVYELLGEDRVALKIAGTPHLARSLREELAGETSARYFMVHPDPMYTQRESELIQQFLAVHGRMPGGDELDDLF